MAGPGLPVNVDSTYPDSGSDASVKTHQQHHDSVHAVVNQLDTALGSALVGQALTWDGSAYVPSTVPQRGVAGTGMVPVANFTCTYPANSTANLPTNGGVFSQLKHVATTDCGLIRLVYGNFFDQGTAAPLEQPGPNLITVRAYVMVNKAGNRVPSTYRYVSASANWNAAGAYVAGDMVRSGSANWVASQASTNQTPSSSSAYWDAAMYWPVPWIGMSATKAVTVQPGQVVISEPVAISPRLVKGEAFNVITIAEPNNGTANTGQYPLGNNFVTTCDWSVSSTTGSAPTDYTVSPPASQVSNASGSKSYGPIVVLGLPKSSGQPVVMLLGDSILLGSGDGNILTNEAGGWGLRTLTDNPTTPTRYVYQHLRSAKGSATGALQYGPGTALRLMLAAGCTHIVDGYGVNDINGSATLATIQANAQARWNTYKALRLKAYATTITPVTTSTDSWVTVGNQTPAANFGLNSKWAQYNDWVRTTPSPLDGYIDVAAAVLDPGGGVWKADYTADGTHPNTTGHVAIATAVPATALFGTPT